jgi:hypothetical protein
MHLGRYVKPDYAVSGDTPDHGQGDYRMQLKNAGGYWRLSFDD